MPGATEISAKGLSFLAHNEGGESSDGLYHAYWDPYGRIETIGIGETHDVHAGEVWTRAQAFADVQNRMKSSIYPAIRALGVDLNQNQFDVCCDLCWNLGPGCMEWDIGRAIKAHNFKLAATYMLAYDKAGGVTVAALVTRRHADYHFFLEPPPPPPDPNHYHWYQTKSLIKGVPSELSIVKFYDEHHGKSGHGKGLEINHRHLVVSAQAVATRAHHSGGWKPYHRGFRYQGLAQRAHGKTVVK